MPKVKGNYDALMSDVKSQVERLEAFIQAEFKPQSTMDNDLVAATLIVSGLDWMANKCHLPIFIAIPAVMRMIGAAYGIKTKAIMMDNMPHKDPGPVVLN